MAYFIVDNKGQSVEMVNDWSEANEIAKQLQTMFGYKFHVILRIPSFREKVFKGDI